MEKEALAIQNVTYAYDKSFALNQVSFRGNLGEILVIVGPNGSGKTTLIKLLFDLLECEKGTIKVGGISNKEIEAKNEMYYLSSENVLPQFLTGDEYVRLMCRMYNVEVDETLYKRLVVYYDMENRINSIIEDYSHGMVKKIQLITAFLLQRYITVVDETLNGIDIEAKEVSKVLLRKLADKGKLVIMCTHDLDLAGEIGDRALVMYKGKIEASLAINDEISLIATFKEIVGFNECDYDI